MNKYEAMFILKVDLTDEDKKTLFQQISDAITKHSGTVTQSAVWAERRKLHFTLKKQHEGLYYLVNFTAPGLSVKDIQHAYSLNENILRVLVSRME